MKGVWYALLLGLFIAPVSGLAQQTVCPWVNKATVVDAPDIPDAATAADTVMVSDGGNNCSFHFQNNGVSYDLQVTIKMLPEGDTNIVASESKCIGEKTPLRGIGNEAVACAINTHATRGEQVAGRVRDKLFIVYITSVAKESPSVRDLLRERATLIAEQVAGNLE